VIATPAVDLRHGYCVQLVGGRPEDEPVSLPDPVAVARGWYELGFESVHVVDLDAALGDGDNLGLAIALLTATPADTQVGGGIRDDTRADALLAAGADRVVIGTRALADPDWLAALAARHPRRVVLALDTRDGLVVSKGWKEATALRALDYLPRLAALPLAGVLSTDVGREGRLEGIDRDWCARVVEASPWPVWISGGVTTLDELEWLDQAGAHAVVLGMAIYTDTLDRGEVAARWGRAVAGDSNERPERGTR